MGLYRSQPFGKPFDTLRAGSGQAPPGVPPARC